MNRQTKASRFIPTMTQQAASLKLSMMKEATFNTSPLSDSQSSISFDHKVTDPYCSYPIHAPISMGPPASSLLEGYQCDTSSNAVKMSISLDSFSQEISMKNHYCRNASDSTNTATDIDASSCRHKRLASQSQKKTLPVKRTRYQRRNSVTASILLQQLKNNSNGTSGFDLYHGLVHREGNRKGSVVNNISSAGEVLKMERRLSNSS